MKILTLHCDYVKFKALKKAIKNIEEISPNQLLKGEQEECLLVLVAVEKEDDLSSSKVLSSEILDIAEKVKTKRIVLYPYAHLSKNLADPEVAVDVINEAEKNLSGFEVLKAPFGYYKELEIKVKGHPLSELSREIVSIKEQEDITDKQRLSLLREISRSKLDTSKIAENDHRIIGLKMDLWSFNKVAPGMVFWHPKGLYLKNKLIESWREIHKKKGYIEISTPQIMDKKLWQLSGHWRLYKENMFISSYENRDFAVKPMNCPGGMLFYKTSSKSYRDLPLRVAEIGVVHRKELSGVLSGLFRLIQFTQDDAHIFCTREQLKDEIKEVLLLFKSMLERFDFKNYRYTISTRSPEKKEKYLGKDEDWKFAEEILSDCLKSLGIKYSIEPGEAKFYGPSLDVQVQDSLGREWQCSTLQLDFQIPKRFDISYKDSDGREKTPFMLHRVVYGSIERFIGILTEHLNGKFPLWLSPNQVKILTLNDDVKDYAKEVYAKLLDEGFQVELNDTNETMGKKVMEAQIQRFNYIVTIGQKEKSSNKLAVKSRDSKNIEEYSLENFISRLKKEIAESKKTNNL